mgnify:CR=1 FL=1
MANTTFQGPVTSKAGFITTGPANVVDADSSISLTVASVSYTHLRAHETV